MPDVIAPSRVKIFSDDLMFFAPTAVEGFVTDNRDTSIVFVDAMCQKA